MNISKKAFVAALGLLVTGLAAGYGHATEAAPTSADTFGVSLVGETRGTTCRQLIQDGWTPPRHATPNVVWDPATGEAQITLSEHDELNMNIRAPECSSLPFLGPVIARMLASEASDRAQECAQAVQLVLRDEAPRKGDIVGDLGALRRHVTEWCPQRFEQQIVKAGK